MIAGIAIGCSAAFLQSVSYLASRAFGRKHPNASIHLLVISHLYMGLGAIGLLIAFQPWRQVSLTQALGPVLLFTIPYWIAQGLLFAVLSRTHASRVSPLLGIKILILALISILFLNTTFSPWQWVAIAACFTAAIISEKAGGRLPPLLVLGVIGVSTCYCISDIFIKECIELFAGGGIVRAAGSSVALSYMLSALLALGIAPFMRHRLRGKWLHSLPYSAAWLGAMLLTFCSIGLVGVVFANIVQSTRGIISVVLGGILAASGFAGLEQSGSVGAVARKTAAAVLMSGAIALFYLGSAR